MSAPHFPPWAPAACICVDLVSDPECQYHHPSRNQFQSEADAMEKYQGKNEEYQKAFDATPEEMGEAAVKAHKGKITSEFLAAAAAYGATFDFEPEASRPTGKPIGGSDMVNEGAPVEYQDGFSVPKAEPTLGVDYGPVPVKVDCQDEYGDWTEEELGAFGSSTLDMLYANYPWLEDMNDMKVGVIEEQNAYIARLENENDKLVEALERLSNSAEHLALHGSPDGDERAAALKNARAVLGEME